MSDDPTPPSPGVSSEHTPAPKVQDASTQAVEETSEPVSAEKDGDAVEFRTSGTRRYRKSDVEVEEGNEEEGEILVVSVKLRPASGSGGVRRRPVEVVEEPEVRSKVTRFATKAAPAATAPAAPATAVVAPVDVTPAAIAAAAPATDAPAVPARAAPRVKFTPRATQGAAGRSVGESAPLPAGLIKYTILTLIMLGAGFMAGSRFGHPAGVAQREATTQSGAPIPKLTTAWPPGRLTQLDAMLAADEHGDLKLAHQLALDIKRDVPDSPELDLYLTTIQVRQNEFKIPENNLARMLDAFTPPREAAAVNEHLGFVYARRRNFPRATSSFSDAASTDPFNPTHFQHWAESERRQGHLQEAVDRFNEALTRLPAGLPSNSSRREEIGMKIRLAQIEMGKDQDLKAEIDTQLKTAVPSGYWLLTAAGYALQHNDMASAASSLQKARATLSADDYTALTNDYFFHSFSGNPDVASLLPPDNPAARVQPFLPGMGYFIDP